MIINDLVHYYNLLAKDEGYDIPQLYYSKEGISFAVVLSDFGEILGLEDLRLKPEHGNKLIPKRMLIPETIKKTSGISSNFLSGNSSYVFGIAAKGKEERARKEHGEFRRFHEEILQGIECEEAKVFQFFLEKWDLENARGYDVLREYPDAFKMSSFVFRVDGKNSFIHEKPEIRSSWEEYKSKSSSEVTGQSLVTGKIQPLSRLHPNISGVKDTLSSGASLVSFNQAAFESYGKSQSFNSPMDEVSTFKYTAALNYLLSDRRHRIVVGDTTLVFWAENDGKSCFEEMLFKEFLSPEYEDPSGSEGETNESAEFTIGKILDRIRRGEKVADEFGVQEDSKFYILGFSPNASRVSLRFFSQNSFGEVIRNLAQHYLDNEIIKKNESPRVIVLRDILRELSPNQDLSRISPLLAGQLMKCILNNKYYGDGPYSQMLQRIAVDKTVNDVRVGFIKACLIRRMKSGNMKGVVTVSLNEENSNTGYLLGRLFAVLEKSQLDVSRTLNKTIKDSYFGSAMTTPSSTFPILIRLAQHHIEKSDYGFIRDKEIGRILAEVEGFPSNLNLPDQGQFVLGYYQQKENYYKSKENQENKEEL